ncbi:MAG: LPS-assembly protein LptD [Gammaproteobacteria bacterium]
MMVACGLNFLTPTDAFARDPFAACGGALRIPEKPYFDGDTSGEVIQITADDADLSQEGISLLRGNVQYNKGPLRMLGQRMRYDKPNERIYGKGDLQLWDQGLYLTGTEAEMDAVTGDWDVRNGTYIFEESHAHGSAQRFTVTKDELISVEEATYTTCNPGDDAWLLEANHIELNQITDVGVARDVKISILGTPVFYSPYLTFPLTNERKSGFLAPSIGVLGSTGLDVTVPYYFNIAPTMDATVGARVMSDRGFMATGEFRYLTRVGEGDIRAELLPHDTEDGDARGQLSVRHSGYFADRWLGTVDYNWVSDRDYFEDFSNTLSLSSIRFLPQSARVQHRNGAFYFSGLVHNYQTVDDTLPEDRRPYARLPQLRAQYMPTRRNRTLSYGGYAEATYFDNSSRVDGLRFDAEPYVSFPIRTAGSFFVPTASLRYTQYALNNSPGPSDSPSRLIPTANIDSGLLLERPLEIGNSSFVQTLEPRAYYLFTAFDGQDDLPLFDTGRYSFNFAQLFRDNRFSGGDRVADAHQVSLALTSRLLTASDGSELVRASIGQIIHFRDRRVQLPGQMTETDGTSDLVAEIGATVYNDWSIRAGTIWDPHEDRTERGTIGLRYQPTPDKVVNASYRFVRDTVETTDVSFRWPILPDVGVVGRWNYALADEQTLEAFAGVEVDTCCWSFRAVGRRHLSDTVGDYTNSIFMQLELKGLAGIGRLTESFLERSIPGYQNPF